MLAGEPLENSMTVRTAARIAAHRPTAALAGFVRRLRRLPRALAAMLERWNQRHDLADLDDRMLADIGVTRAEADRECARSPGANWR